MLEEFSLNNFNTGKLIKKMKIQAYISIKPGFWTSAGKNPFWINIINNQVYWLGMNQKTQSSGLGEQWCHVGFGKINDDQIHLKWSDIPVGEDQLSGKIIIKIIDETHIKVIEDSGNFGKSEWTWVSDGKSFSDFN